MNSTHPSSVRHHSEAQRAERAGSFSHKRDRIVAAIARALHGLFGTDNSLVPIPVKVAVTQRRNQRRSRD